MSHVPTVKEVHRVRYDNDDDNRSALCSCGFAVSLSLKNSRNAQVVILMGKHIDRHKPSEIARRSAEYMRTRSVIDKFLPQGGLQ